MHYLIIFAFEVKAIFFLLPPQTVLNFPWKFTEKLETGNAVTVHETCRLYMQGKVKQYLDVGIGAGYIEIRK
jgi:hypothetical protein